MASWNPTCRRPAFCRRMPPPGSACPSPRPPTAAALVSHVAWLCLQPCVQPRAQPAATLAGMLCTAFVVLPNAAPPFKAFCLLPNAALTSTSAGNNNSPGCPEGTYCYNNQRICDSMSDPSTVTGAQWPALPGRKRAHQPCLQHALSVASVCAACEVRTFLAQRLRAVSFQ